MTNCEDRKRLVQQTENEEWPNQRAHRRFQSTGDRHNPGNAVYVQSSPTHLSLARFGTLWTTVKSVCGGWATKHRPTTTASGIQRATYKQVAYTPLSDTRISSSLEGPNTCASVHALACHDLRSHGRSQVNSALPGSHQPLNVHASFASTI